MIGFMVVVPMVVAPQGPITLVRTDSHWWGPFKVGEVPNEGQESIIGDVESDELEGSFFFSDCPSGSFWFLPRLLFCSNGPLATDLLFWAVIIIVCDAARMLSSRVENLSAWRYISSIVTGGSKDRDWKNGVVSPKLLLKFCKTASILFTSICCTACPNLRVKSRMDSSSRLRIA